MFKIGYNTNGFACHSLVSAIEIIGSLGYESVAITIDHHALNPWDDHFDIQLARVKKALNAYNLATVIETSARVLLTYEKSAAPLPAFRRGGNGVPPCFFGPENN